MFLSATILFLVAVFEYHVFENIVDYGGAFVIGACIVALTSKDWMKTEETFPHVRYSDIRHNSLLQNYLHVMWLGNALFCGKIIALRLIYKIGTFLTLTIGFGIPNYDVLLDRIFAGEATDYTELQLAVTLLMLGGVVNEGCFIAQQIGLRIMAGAAERGWRAK